MNVNEALSHFMPGEGIILTKGEDGLVTAWETTVKPLQDNHFVVHAYFTADTVEEAVAGLENMSREEPDWQAWGIPEAELATLDEEKRTFIRKRLLSTAFRRICPPLQKDK